jgi:Carboxypeptidase regulatory-like domain
MRKRRSIHPAVMFLFVAGLLMSLSVDAQTFRGAINGAVTDPSGAAVPGARVETTNTATGNSRSSITTTDGQFSFQDLTPGSYRVTVTADGFPVSTIDNITVTAGNVYTLPVNLAIARQTTSVEVSAAAIALDTPSEV